VHNLPGMILAHQAPSTPVALTGTRRSVTWDFWTPPSRSPRTAPTACLAPLSCSVEGHSSLDRSLSPFALPLGRLLLGTSLSTGPCAGLGWHLKRRPAEPALPVEPD